MSHLEHHLKYELISFLTEKEVVADEIADMSLNEKVL